MKIGVSLEKLILIRIQTVNIPLLNYQAGKDIERILKRRSSIYKRELNRIGQSIFKLIQESNFQKKIEYLKEIDTDSKSTTEEIEKSENICPWNTNKIENTEIGTFFSTPAVYLICNKSDLNPIFNFYKPDLIVVDSGMYKEIDINGFGILVCPKKNKI